MIQFFCWTTIFAFVFQTTEFSIQYNTDSHRRNIIIAPFDTMLLAIIAASIQIIKCNNVISFLVKIMLVKIMLLSVMRLNQIKKYYGFLYFLLFLFILKFSSNYCVCNIWIKSCELGGGPKCCEKLQLSFHRHINNFKCWVVDFQQTVIQKYHKHIFKW